LRISQATYYRWLASGKLRGVRAGRDWRFPRATVDELLGAGGPSPRESVDRAAVALRARGLAKKEVEAMSNAPESVPGENLVRLLLRHAQLSRATAVHVEPGAGATFVRERVDGALSPAAALPAAAARELAHAARRLAGSDEDVESRPGTFRFAADIAGRRLDVLAATYPAAAGPAVTLRFCDPDQAVPKLEALGFGAPLCAAIRRALRRPGLFVVNGPTNSGKTTTLYSILRDLIRPDLKIMTAENPVEVMIAGVQQCEISLEKGVTLASAAKAMLHHDVDVAMVAEVRDSETLLHLIALAATGRRSFTVLHAPDAPTALHRLVDVSGGHRSVIADSVSGILNQRLVRRACPACASRSPVRPEDARLLGIDAKRKVVTAKGCSKCRDSGFRGATAVGELLTLTAALRKAMEAGGGPDELRHAAEPGRTLRDELAEKVLAGEVAADEASRILASP